MKKLLRFLAAFVLVFGVLGVLIFLFVPNMFYGKMYMGNRIKGNVTITVDGTKAVLSECAPECLHAGELIDFESEGGKLKVRGNEEGLYAFSALCNGADLRFYIDKPTAEDCVSFDVDFNIDTSKQVIHYAGKYRYFSEGLLKADDVPVYGDYSLEYEHHSIGVYVNTIN